MTSARSAHAPGLPLLRLSHVPELEGNRLRLHVQRMVFGGGGNRPERGASWFFLSPTDDREDFEAQVSLPLEQAEALAAACAAFNAIMDKHEHSAASPEALPSRSTAPRAQSLATAAAQVAILAGFLPAIAARCLGLL